MILQKVNTNEIFFNLNSNQQQFLNDIKNTVKNFQLEKQEICLEIKNRREHKYSVIFFEHSRNKTRMSRYVQKCSFFAI